MIVFGWRDCYRYDNKDIDFSLTKTYRHHSMESVSDTRISMMYGDGCVLIFRTLDPHRCVISEGEVDIKRDRRGRQKIEPKVEEAWIDVFMWALYRRSGPNGEHCASEAGGTLFVTPILEASFWLVERLQCMMKW
ncbi:hypothetical protein Poli38472_014261 [Pythium oligandrum]|uniref:Uncharacterized protein n=1 Tax=Pythium oligandrum TaxID=41045 RepID=A0A8K1CJE4_PYTOL|nr:hypothetical protein Poli38472_014261 [Pythium oligandrum]|eukprot:TMW64144.1 hypothetical protein Poli38472_014261 [Pythium oligandrum]